MLTKQSGQMGFGDMEAMGWLPEGHFLKKTNDQIIWRHLRSSWNPFIIPPNGSPAIPLVMFKALLLEQWYGLSDPGLKEAICGRLSFERFLGLSMQDPFPDETRICWLPNLLA
jgi:IS5 family transposase